MFNKGVACHPMIHVYRPLIQLSTFHIHHNVIGFQFPDTILYMGYVSHGT